jgi:protocatechuate 3,4-dioxygenase alpha subunit
VFGRGVIKRLATRLYFADGEGNDVDPILSRVPEQRRNTLLATRTTSGSWWLDIVLQGKHETVFFDL